MRQAKKKKNLVVYNLPLSKPGAALSEMYLETIRYDTSLSPELGWQLYLPKFGFFLPSLTKINLPSIASTPEHLR